MFLLIYTQGMCVSVYVCKKKIKKLPTYLPYFSVARYANTTIFLGGPKLAFLIGPDYK